MKAPIPFPGAKSRTGVTAARLTLTQEVVVQIHGPVPCAGLIQRQYAGLQNRSSWFKSMGPCQRRPQRTLNKPAFRTSVYGVNTRCGHRFQAAPRTAYRAGVTAARSALTRSEEVQSLCPVPYGSIAKLVKATDCRSVTARSNRAGTSIRRCTQEAEESAPEKRQAGDCAWVQILPSAPFTPLVQLAERRTYNSEVRSSNLRGRTNRAPGPGGPCAPIWENA